MSPKPNDDYSDARIRPERLHESLREPAGIAEHPLAEKFPFGLTDKEKLAGFWG